MKNVKLALGVGLALVLAADTVLACGMYRIKMPAPEPEGVQLLVKAQDLEEQGKWQAAARAYDRIVRLDGVKRFRKVDAALGAARMYSALGWDKTRRLRLKEAARIGRKDPEAQLAYADSIVDRYPAKALKVLNRLEQNAELTLTEETDMFALKSIAFAGQGDTNAARDSLSEAELGGMTTELLARARTTFAAPATQSAPVVAKR